MVTLTLKERSELIEILLGVRELWTAEGRRTVLEMAGLGGMAARLLIDGETLLVTLHSMVGDLSRRGRMNRDQEALGLFLNAVKTLIGAEHREFIDELLIRHSMMTPAKDPLPIDHWAGTRTPEQVQEKIITSNTLRPIAFLSHGLEVSRAVAFLRVQDGAKAWSATGFLLAPSLLVTCHHVVPEQRLLKGTQARFNYEDDRFGNPLPSSTYKPPPDGFFHTEPSLDYSVLELEGRPGDDWGWLRCAESPPGEGDRVNIIQHPAGRPKEIALQSNYVEYSGADTLQYVTATLQGSSGSPVLDDAWRVCALHCRGGPLRRPDTGAYCYTNEGLRIERMLADLPEHLRNMISGE